MKKILLILLTYIFSIPLIFASNADSSSSKKLNLIVEYQWLRSTHTTTFKGIDVILSKQITDKKLIGLGLEYSKAPFHGDNGYYLYDLKFIPVFIDYRYNLNRNRNLTPYLLADVGYSFVSYDRELINDPQSRAKVKEGGVYLQGAIGLNYKISPFIQTCLSAGFKGFHNSFNNLDINPHGLVLRGGININW